LSITRQVVRSFALNKRRERQGSIAPFIAALSR
jgi:hypothetical protein